MSKKVPKGSKLYWKVPKSPEIFQKSPKRFQSYPKDPIKVPKLKILIAFTLSNKFQNV